MNTPIGPKRRTTETLPAGRSRIRRALSLLTLALAALGLGGSKCSADGIPEPSLVMYGIVSDAQGVRQTNGVLSVTILRPAGFPPLVLQATLTNLNDQFSYVLFIPCETELPGFAVTAVDRLRLLPAVQTFDRSTVTFNGAKILYTSPALGTLSITSKDRGRFDRVDFSPTGASAYDVNGLLKAWELQYFGHLGVDPNADPDGDGMSNLSEMLAGTNPNDPGSQLAFIAVEPVVGGGAHIVWSSQPGKVYRILRSRDLLGGFAPLGQGQAANPPANQYYDTTAVGEGPYFYRIAVIGQ